MKPQTISNPSAPRAGFTNDGSQASRHSYTRLCLALLSVLAMLLPMGAAKAATVSGNVFLQGDYVEVGIHPSGSFGTSVAAPAGFHPRPTSGATTGALGFVADAGKDGWTTGTPGYIGDFFVPGSPEEGWSIEWNTAGGGAEHTFGNYGLRGLFQVPATSLTETTSGDTRSAVWEGEAVSGAEKLKVIQTVRFNRSDAFFVINVTLINTGTVPIDSVEYMRNVDPDNEVTLPSGSYTTDNYSLNDDATNQRLIVGRGITYSSICGLGTIDPRAVVSTEGFANRDPDAILDSPILPSAAAPNRADQAIVLAYRFGTLAPGQSVSIDYAYILNAADLTVALGRLASVSILQPTGTVSGNSVIFQGTTDSVATTTQMQFFVNDVSVGIDTTPDAGGVFESTFDSTAYANGTVNLKVIATFSAGAPAEKTATVTVGNSGPPIAFLTPTAGQSFAGASTPVEITINAGHPPVRVNFFRETAASGSVSLGEDTTAPFQATFSVTDLPPDETVIIKAVAADSLNRLTTIQVSGTTAPANIPPTAGADSLHPPATLAAFPIDVLANDGDTDAGDSVTVTGVTNGAFGTVAIGAGGLNVIYTPGAGYAGSDTFTYTISDTHSATATATVTLTNTAPTGLPDKKVVGNDTVNIPVLLNDSDADGDTVSILSVTSGALGATALAGGGVDYDPAGTLATDDTFTYTITDGRGATATITVTAYSLSLQSGFYVGFISDGTGNDGMALLRLSRAGSLSGTVSLNGLRYRTKGIIDADGHAVITISREGVPVVLTLDLTPGATPEMAADVARETSNWGGVISRSPYSTSNPPPQLGRYTFVLPPDPAAAGDPAFPQGHGMGVAVVSKSGKVRYAGRTADGAPFSCGSSIRTDATSPLYGGLYRAPRGFVEGTITFRDVAGVSDFDGVLNWVKPVQTLPKPLYPAGFALQTAAIGSRYTRPASIHDVLVLGATSRVTVAMSEGGIAGVLNASALIGSLNPAGVTLPLNKLTLSTINGKFNGTFTHPVTGQRLGLHGVVLQKQNLGFGYFSSKIIAGEVSMTPVP